LFTCSDKIGGDFAEGQNHPLTEDRSRDAINFYRRESYNLVALRQEVYEHTNTNMRMWKNGACRAKKAK
jgi:hypothetical protein